jgi:hypothetical protein
MQEEKFILEINPRTKEKKTINLLDYYLFENYTIRDLINEHNQMKEQIKKLNLLNAKLIDVVSNINKSALVQIADIKEEIK